MSTKLVKYHDSKTIVNGTTTIVYGVTEISPTGKVADSMDKAMEAMRNLFSSCVVSKGVAKLSPEDSYVESTGVVVASKKAERVGSRALRGNVVKAISTLETLVADLKNDLAALDSRCDMLKSDAH